LKGVGIWQTSPPVSGVGKNRTKPGAPILTVTVRMGFYRGLTASWRFESSPFSSFIPLHFGLAGVPQNPAFFMINVTLLPAELGHRVKFLALKSISVFLIDVTL
jgi:hypothetical protein